MGVFRNYLKNVFWPHIFVGAMFQILDKQQVACGLKLGPAARVPAKPLGKDGIWNQNPIFKMTYSLVSSLKRSAGLGLIQNPKFETTILGQSGIVNNRILLLPECGHEFGLGNDTAFHKGFTACFHNF